MATPHAESHPLVGRRVLICRPEPEASRLAQAFEAAGAHIRTLPLIVREPLPETPEQRSLLLDLDRFSHIIVVSPYAARRLLEALDTWWPQLPTGLRWYAVGAGTARVLASHGLSVRRPADGWTSEALLTLPSLRHVQGQSVLIARGEHGRELIRDTLERRGARVTALPLYRRQPATPDEPTLRAALDEFAPEAIVALSGETIDQLAALVANRPGGAVNAQGANGGHNLYDSLMIVPAERVARSARAAGFARSRLPAGMADGDIVAAVAAELSPQR
ncbi:uroporphyrinogen-III synthase [Marinobacter sp. C2H3]|uniref:uroporphyrinogen-III synthase n=1 Tax=Marinobacter sp. C2H3 TaxID=3119003 RepID=UPI00300E8CB9